MNKVTVQQIIINRIASRLNGRKGGWAPADSAAVIAVALAQAGFGEAAKLESELAAIQAAAPLLNASQLTGLLERAGQIEMTHRAGRANVFAGLAPQAPEAPQAPAQS